MSPFSTHKFHVVHHLYLVGLCFNIWIPAAHRPYMCFSCVFPADLLCRPTSIRLSELSICKGALINIKNDINSFEVETRALFQNRNSTHRCASFSGAILICWAMSANVVFCLLEKPIDVCAIFRKSGIPVYLDFCGFSSQPPLYLFDYCTCIHV